MLTFWALWYLVWFPIDPEIIKYNKKKIFAYIVFNSVQNNTDNICS